MDTCCMFPPKGFKTRVFIDLPKETYSFRKDLKINPPQVIAFNTDTRNSTNLQIENQYNNLFGRHKWIFDQCNLFKKVDSTARGNLGFEINLILNKMNLPYAFICISYPELNRTQENGILTANDVPIDLGKDIDQLFPNFKSQINKLLEIQSKLKTGLITLKQISKGTKYLLTSIQNLIDSETKIICFDAVTRSDIDQISEVITKYFAQGMLVGSAGLAKSISKSFVGQCSHKRRRVNQFKKPFALISLSSHQITRAHFKTLSNSNQMQHISIHNHALSCKENFEEEYSRISSIIDEAIVSKQNITLNQSSISTCNNSIPNTASKTLNTFLSKISLKLINSEFFQTFILIGGDTAKTFLQGASIEEIDVLDEVLPGTVIGIPSPKHHKTFTIITKSGGFGDKNHLAELLSKLL